MSSATCGNIFVKENFYFQVHLPFSYYLRAQNWGHLYELTRPFKNASDVDITRKMEELHFDEYRMYNMSDEFYMSLGLPTSYVSYNPPSIIVKPTDRTIECHANAWDFCDGWFNFLSFYSVK